MRRMGSVRETNQSESYADDGFVSWAVCDECHMELFGAGPSRKDAFRRAVADHNRCQDGECPMVRDSAGNVVW